MSRPLPSARPVDRYFASYADDHQNPLNQQIHLVAVPAILWSVVALLWCLPPLITWFQNGIWAGLAMFAAWSWYNRLSRPLGLGMLAVFFVFGCSCRLLEARIGLGNLAWLAVAVFVVAWVAQFVGHRAEGRRPSFLTDLTYLLIGPAWVLAKLYRRFDWRW
ncbi:Mpo1-like protein [Stenotrophomonas sp. C3(2023)]|uniref:Mpo1 family 2-hydroxy fatty acid dioxygenase n=1 Tax=Stenotrophomonas sp. C3(2023) TaxID=3080277 RepID=UPI00293CE9ED|nr:Mpo1-like protein [Stenotrophomonas sp. C3(2023)]MDV3469965.1 Mpo1-like protein [Stenotrophomonas sp. C3(2023)]